MDMINLVIGTKTFRIRRLRLTKVVSTYTNVELIHHLGDGNTRIKYGQIYEMV